MKVLLTLSLVLNLMLFAVLAAVLGTQLLPAKAPSKNQMALEAHVMAMTDHLQWGNSATHFNQATAALYGSWMIEDNVEGHRLMRSLADQSEQLPQHLEAFEKVAEDRMNTLIANTEKLARVEAELKACKAVE